MSMRIDQKLPLSGGEHVIRFIALCFRLWKIGGGEEGGNSHVRSDLCRRAKSFVALIVELIPASIPSPRSPQIPNFFLTRICNFEIIGIGNNARLMSINEFQPAENIA